MSAPICFSSRQVLRFRVALLDATGAPDPGAENGYVSNLVSIAMTPVIEAGDEFILKDGAGDICASFRDCDKIKGNDAVVTLCNLDAQLIALMTGAMVFEDATGVMGLKLPLLNDACPVPVCVEWWTLAQDGSSQATISGVAQYFHFVIPLVKFVPGSWTFENGILAVVLNGKGEENPNVTVNGPFNDWPTGVVAADGAKSALAYWRESTLPAAACDYIEVTSAAS